jgi:putative ABC transport system permease protein
MNEVLKKFPTIAIFEVDQMIARIQKIINQVTRAIELVLGLILVSGALVLIASVQASIDQRLLENAMLRTLGAGRKLILGALCIEFVSLGLGAGLMAALGSELTAWALQTQVFKMEYTLHGWLWLLGPAIGALLIGALGVVSCLRVVNVAPMVVLRELASV